MSAPGASGAVRYDKDAYRIQRGDDIVAMALRLANGAWSLYDTSDRRLSKRTWTKPAEVAKAFDEIDNGTI